MTPHDEMIAKAKEELEAQPAAISSALGIDIEIAKASWLKSSREDYERVIRHYNGMPKSYTIPLDKSAYIVALGDILRENGLLL